MEPSSTDAPSRPRRNRRLTIGSVVILIAVIACGLGAYRHHVLNAKHIVKSYPVGDLLASGRSVIAGQSRVNFTPLIASIQSNVSPSSWQGRGGSGRITPFFLNESLIIRNRPDVHKQVETFLRNARKPRRRIP